MSYLLKFYSILLVTGTKSWPFDKTFGHTYSKIPVINRSETGEYVDSTKMSLDQNCLGSNEYSTSSISQWSKNEYIQIQNWFKNHHCWKYWISFHEKFSKQFLFECEAKLSNDIWRPWTLPWRPRVLTRSPLHPPSPS